MRKTKSGFTIVELLIVIVVIAILAAISVVAYTGIQTRTRNAKIDSDLAVIEKAIMAARINNSSPLYNIVQLGGPEAGCLGKPSGTDLATLDKNTDTCWTHYALFLDRVSTASGIDIRRITDPWGRPYYVNPNEDENTTTHVCLSDRIGTYSQPFTSGGVGPLRHIPFYKPNC